MNEYAVMPKEHYVALCDFIREKLGTEGLIRSGEVLAKLREVVSFTDDANATPEDMVKGSSAWVKGKKVEGNVEVLTGIGGSGEPGIFKSTFGVKFLEISYTREKPVFLKEQAKISAYATSASFGNAKKDDVPEGVTFTSVEGVAVEGTVKKLTGLSGVGSVSGECDSEGHITATFYNNEPAFLYPDIEVKVKMNPSEFGNAETDDVEKGKIFTSVAGIRQVGTGKGYDQGYSDGYADGQSAGTCHNPHVYHAVGTENLPPVAIDGSLAIVECPHEFFGTWVLNRVITMGFFGVNVNFTSNGNSYDSIATYGALSYGMNGGLDSLTAYSGTWVDEASRTLTFTEAPDGYTDLLPWLKQNGVQTEAIGTMPVLYSRVDGEWLSEEDENFTIKVDTSGTADFINELMEWNIVTSSANFEAYVVNKHPSKYLIANITLTEVTSGGEESDSEQIVVEPDSGYTYEKQAASQSTYWWIDITEVRFSEDGT